jgi:hypothetical protein
MGKPLKISYKIYANDRLKETSFHGKKLLPLYIQVVYNRNNIQFRSYYFDLFANPKYSIIISGVHGPEIEQIKALEAALIEFIIEKLGDAFSLEQFRKAYDIYSIDLCDFTEPAFRDYVKVFFEDEGMGDLGLVLKEGGRYRMMHRVIIDMKRILNGKFYQKLIDHAFYYAPPYLPLFRFMETKKKWPMLSLSVMEWETGDTKEQFAEFVGKAYSAEEAETIKKQIDVWVASIKDGQLKHGQP